jgi:glutamine amidotransferase
MCRLVAIINPQNQEIAADALRQFGSLAETGKIPPGTDNGHKDGWGVAAYKNGAVAFFKKNPLDASRDPEYQAAIKDAAKTDPSLILGHLRKASRGKISIENTQPYTFGPYTFCHNGTLSDFEKMMLEPKYLARRKGASDSEVVFLYLLQKIEATGDFLGGFLEGIKQMRRMDYTALNILISNGKTLLALREVNENDGAVKKDDLCDTYYTLLQGKDASGVTRFICSQPLDISDVSWTQIPNHAVLVLDEEIKEEKIVRL